MNMTIVFSFFANIKGGGRMKTIVKHTSKWDESCQLFFSKETYLNEKKNVRVSKCSIKQLLVSETKQKCFVFKIVSYLRNYMFTFRISQPKK